MIKMDGMNNIEAVNNAEAANSKKNSGFMFLASYRRAYDSIVEDYVNDSRYSKDLDPTALYFLKQEYANKGYLLLRAIFEYGLYQRDFTDDFEIMGIMESLKGQMDTRREGRERKWANKE